MNRSLHYRIAADAMESVLSLPGSSNLWQRLVLWILALDEAERADLTQQLAQLSLGIAGEKWLHCSAMAYLTRDQTWLIAQAKLADDTTPTDAIMAFLGIAWHHALARTPDRHAFVQLLNDLNMATLQALVARRVPITARAHSESQTRLRVAIYTPQIVGAHHGGTTLTLNVMSTLISCCEVQTFTAQETTVPAIESYGGAQEFVRQLPVDVQALQLHVPGSAQLQLPTTEFSLRLRFEQVLDTMREIQPDVVLFVGFMSPLVFRLYAHFPVVGLSLHALPPLAPVDVWLSANPNADANPWHNVPPPHTVDFPFRFWPRGRAGPVDRSSVQWPAAAVVLATAGYRLDIEVAPPWSELMWSYVDAHEDVYWVLIGLPDGVLPAGLRPHPRIYCQPPRLDLPAWLAACDIYVAPMRVGGGGSVAMAMEQGLPVLVLADTDGGDKVGAWASASMEAYFDQLARWVRDPVARRQAGDELQARFHARLDISTAPAQHGLMQACHAAISSFKQRTEIVDAAPHTG